MLEKLPIPIPSLDTQAEILDAPVPAEIADMTDPNKKDIWDVLPGFFKKPTKVSACDYLSAWIGIKIKKLKKIDRDSNDLLQFNYLMELAHSTKAAKNKVLNLWNLEEETGIDGDSLQDWIIGLEEHLNDLNGISKIPQGPALMNVLAMTASNLESLNQYCILESGEENGPVLLGGFWEYPDERYQDASALTSRLINILNMAIAVLCEEVKVSFEHKQSSVTPRGETVKCEITVRNQGIMPVRSLRVSSRVNELGGDPNSDLDWGEKNCSYLPEKGKDILHFEGKRPIIKGDITLSLFWKALLLNGTLTEGFQQVPLRLGMVEDSFKLQGQVIQEKLPFNKSPTVISKEISELSGSPYVAGDPVGNKEDVFFGRETLIDSIRRQVIKSGNVILLEGNRRTGKTSILQYLEGSTSIPGWLSIYCTLHNAKGSPDAVGVPTEEVFREMALCIAKGIVFGMKLECPLPNNKTQPPGEILGIAKACREGIGKEAPFADFREYLETILEVLQQKNLGLLLMTDEFDKLQEGIDNKVTSPQVPENIRALIHQYPRFSAILTGSRRLKKMRQEYWSALFGLGTRESVSSLEPDAAVKLITEPVKGQLSFSNDAVEKICLLTARQPYLTQCICTRIFDLAARENNRSITLDFVDRASDVLIKNNEHFASLWDYARSDRRRFLLALLQKESENRDPLRLGIIQEKLLSNGIEVGDDLLSEDLEHLQELELIKLIGEDQDGQYKLEVPLMGYWIQKQQDFSMLQKKAISETEDQG
jgi:type I restriction enzyme M protein